MEASCWIILSLWMVAHAIQDIIAQQELTIPFLAQMVLFELPLMALKHLIVDLVLRVIHAKSVILFQFLAQRANIVRAVVK